MAALDASGCARGRWHARLWVKTPVPYRSVCVPKRRNTKKVRQLLSTSSFVRAQGPGLVNVLSLQRMNFDERFNFSHEIGFSRERTLTSPGPWHRVCVEH